ncbi:MAG: hypothetical protein H0A75_01300 [Candidatus Methanofishera endochildressiae]|uniref:Uncharacterized protein n=1 Tax=Candidatus Methanofishera endochildressiae TaxID=2738884 RepID=A0A7Z0MN71_9GAMM|nr:hypothetical protein [Candidatus Methanofishera endochildressiae]
MIMMLNQVCYKEKLRLLKEEQIELQARVVVTEEQLETAEDYLKQAESQREECQDKYKQVSHELGQKCRVQRSFCTRRTAATTLDAGDE